MFIKFHQPYSYCYFYFAHILDRTDWLQSIYCQLNEGTADTHRKYPLNSVLHISKKYCTFAQRHHFSNFETRIRNLALHQHKLMEVIP